jgi:hypothetical protein
MTFSFPVLIDTAMAAPDAGGRPVYRSNPPHEAACELVM